MIRKNFFFQIVFFIVISFTFGCNSFQIIPEPNLEQVTFKSETICTEILWYSPFCKQGKSKSFMIKGVYNNLSGEKKYSLIYHLDLLDTDLPVGLSLKLDGIYYNLKKTATDYTDILKLESELNSVVIGKINESKNNIEISYSNRTDTLNFVLTSGETKDFIKQLNEVTKKVNAQEKMKIVK